MSHSRVVSVPKFSPTPRLSIIVPVGSDIPAFENTLISVLENRPEHSEIIVAHGGNYDDPFMLADEVEFLVTASTQLARIVAEAANVARGHIVHVLADGIIATEGWTEPALELFEQHDTAIVAPVVRDRETGDIVNAGWFDSAARLCHGLAVGQNEVRRRDINRVDGAYLQASFWRRDVLVSLENTFDSASTLESAYAHTLVAQVAGWRSALATNSNVYCEQLPEEWTTSSFSRGQRLRAIHDCIHGESSGTASCVHSLLRNMLRPSQYAECLGQAASTLATSSVRKRLNLESVASVQSSELTTIRFEQEATASYRRAA